MDRFFNKMKGDTEPIIAFGSAKFSPTGRGGELSAPTTSIFKKVKRTFKKVKLVDEYNTSQVCNCCGKKCRKVFKKSLIVKGETKTNVEARGLRWCSTSRIFFDRDVNAALNVRDCCFERSYEHLTRNSATTEKQSSLWLS